MKCKIVSSGMYLPKRIVTNDELGKYMDTSDEWIYSRSGIKERRYCEEENTSDMAYEACLDALNKVNINKDEIGLVLCATFTPDDFTPSVACKILDKLGVKAMAFDLNAACSGFIYALNTAASLLESNNYKYALVVGADKMSKVLDYSDRGSTILFGDGAGAVLISNEDNECYFYCKAKTDSNNVLYAKSLENKLFENSYLSNHYLKMNGREVFKFAVDICMVCINRILEQSNLTLDDIKLIIPHQANIRIIQYVCNKLNIREDMCYINLTNYGNTSAGSIAIALNEVLSKNLVSKGDKVLMVGFGAGLSWASSIITI